MNRTSSGCAQRLALGFALFLSPALGHAEDCDGVLSRSAASMQAISDRAAEVQHCLDLVDELKRSAYRSSFSMCENLALSQEASSTIELPNGETLSAQGGWSDLVSRVGETASTSGCRDGVLAALQRSLFVDTARVRSLFQETGLSLDNLLVDDYDLGVGTLSVNSTRLQGGFTSYDGIRAVGEGLVEVKAVPFVFDLVGDAQMRSLFGSADMELGLNVEGLLGGYLVVRDLKVVVRDFRPTKIIPGPATLLPDLVGRVMRDEITRRSSEIAAEASHVLTQALRRSYESANPFSFLSGGI